MTETSSRDDVPALRQRVAELEAAEAQRDRAEEVQNALYRIAETASVAEDMQDFYRQIHAIVAELMYADNFYIALYDPDRDMINFPYFIDEVDPDIPDPQRLGAVRHRQRGGHHRISAAEGLPDVPHDWPTAGPRRPQGAHHRRRAGDDLARGPPSIRGPHDRRDGRAELPRGHRLHSQSDLDLLVFVGRHVASALERTRLIDETRQRSAELALVNDVQRGLAENGWRCRRCMTSSAIGSRRSSMPRSSISASCQDGLVHFPYTIERGCASTTIRSSSSASVGSRSRRGSRSSSTTTSNDGRTQSGSPSPSRRAAEVVRLRSARRRWIRATGRDLAPEHRPGARVQDADVRLLTTLAGSLSVALENARLFEETRQRNAELSLINDVQRGLAENLDMQAMYDLVGQRINEIFDAQTVDIGVVDRDGSQIALPVLDRARRSVPRRAVEVMGVTKTSSRLVSPSSSTTG